jgi:hypothetical protein
VRNRLALVDTRFLDAVEATGDITPRRRHRPTWFARTAGIPRREARERLAAATRLSPGHDPWAPIPAQPDPTTCRRSRKPSTRESSAQRQ